MAKKSKHGEYTHSVWSGRAYDKPPTDDELAEEGMAALNHHPTISKLLHDRSAYDRVIAELQGEA